MFAINNPNMLTENSNMLTENPNMLGFVLTE